MKKSVLLLTVCFCLLSCGRKVDVLVVGGGAGGTAAGIQAARMGASVVIAEPTTWLGGMLTSAGVSAIDGNYCIAGGIFREFCDSLARRYGGYDALRSGWVSNVLFQPRVGEEVLENIAAGEPGLLVLTGTTFEGARKLRRGWEVTLRCQDGRLIKWRVGVLIDGTELGDVARACGVRYDIAPAVQDMTYVITVQDFGPGADRTIPRPEGYDPALYANCCINPLNTPVFEKGQTLWSPEMMLSYGRLPVLPEAAGSESADGSPQNFRSLRSLHPSHNLLRPASQDSHLAGPSRLRCRGWPRFCRTLPPVWQPPYCRPGGREYMLNWPIEGNDYYADVIDASAEEREEVFRAAKQRALGYLYFIQTELGYRNLGIAEGEYPTPDGLPFYPYHRESRHIAGEALFSVDDAADPYADPDRPLYRAGVAVGDYPVDHHHFRHPDWKALRGAGFQPIPAFTVPAGVLIPLEVDDLIVAEKSVSVTSEMNGSTRLQPVVMGLGQAAGVIAALATGHGRDASAGLAVDSAYEAAGGHGFSGSSRPAIRRDRTGGKPAASQAKQAISPDEIGLHGLTDCRRSSLTDCRRSCLTDCRKSCLTDCRKSCLTDCRRRCLTDCRRRCLTDCRRRCLTDCRRRCQPRDVSVRAVQSEMLASGAYIQPYRDLCPDDPGFAALQRIGSTGILRAEGRNEGWSNQMWLRASDTLRVGELYLEDFPWIAADLASRYAPEAAGVVASEATDGVATGVAGGVAAGATDGVAPEAAGGVASGTDCRVAPVQAGGILFGAVTRQEAAVLIDSLYHPFELRDVDWNGNFLPAP